jgi:hypothetical protein
LIVVLLVETGQIDSCGYGVVSAGMVLVDRWY